MNYYDARQHLETKLWKYTVMNDNRFWEVGYCALESCKGHETQAGAYQHYKEFILDTKLKFYNPENPTSLEKCQICGAWTSGKGELDWSIFTLCPEHQTRENASDLYGSVGACSSSY